MKATEIVQTLQNKKGQHVQVTWQRVVETVDDCPLVIAKRTCAWVRAGIEYANLATVKQEAEANPNKVVKAVTWKEWIQYPFIFRHRVKLTEYVALYPATFPNLRTPAVEWSLNGAPATYEQVEPYLAAGEKHKDKAVKVFTLRADSVVSIGS